MLAGFHFCGVGGDLALGVVVWLFGVVEAVGG